MKYNRFAVVVLAFIFTINMVFAAPSKRTVKQFSSKITDINLSIEKNDYRTADKLIYDAINEHPGNIQIQLLSAISLIMQDKLDSAQDLLDSIKKSALSYADLYYAQAAIYLKRVETSDMRFRNKRNELIQLAIKQLEYSLKINPNIPRTYNALGVAELKRENLFEAQKYFEKAIALKPNYSTALDNLGSIHYITSEFDKAFKLYKKAELANPSSATVYYHLAQLELKNEKLNNALYYANKSLLWNRKSPYTHNLIGEIYKKQGNESAALIAFQKSIFLKPEYTSPYINLAKIYEGRGDVHFAIENLKTCYSLSPNDDALKIALADLIYSTGQYEEALKYYSLISDKYKDIAVEGLVSCYYSIATDMANKSLFRSNKKLSDALVYINQAIKENPDNLELYLTKSKIVQLLNSPIESKDVLLKIVSAPNVNLTDILTKGEAYIALNQYRDARNIYTLAVMTPKTLENDLYLAEYFTSAKQYIHAKEVLNNILAKESNNYEALNNMTYVDKMIDYSNLQYKNALLLEKQRNKFFTKVYLNKALKFNPNNIEANIKLAKLLQKEKEYCAANKCYKIALAALDDEKAIKKIAKETKKLDKKMAKIESKKIKNSNFVDNNIVPLGNNADTKDLKPVVNIKEKNN